MSINRDIAIPKTLLDFIEARDRVILLFRDAKRSVEAADAECKRIGTYLYPRQGHIEATDKQFIADLDRSLWRQAFNHTGFFQLMDKEAHAEFDRSLRDTPPEFTEANVREIFLSLAQDSELMFRRGLVNVFLRLSKDYRTNEKEPFKVGRKIVVGYLFELRYTKGVRVRYGSEATINDIDRVFKVLDGQKHAPRALEVAINAAMTNGSGLYEDDYFKVRGFKNGNGHIEFKRADLLDKANLLIHEHYKGRALGGGS